MTYDHVKRFINKYGLLTEGSNHAGDNYLEWSAAIREALRLIDSKQREHAIAIFNANHKVARFTHRIRWCSVTTKGKLEIVPVDLLSALMLQLEAAITQGTKFRRCKHCGTWFAYGPGTPHSVRKEFCAPRCRVAEMRQRQAAGEGASDCNEMHQLE